MNVTYFKRFKMAIDLFGTLPAAELPEGYFWVPWDPTLLGVFAEVKFHCFQGEIDAAVFPSLSDLEGCSHLMKEITRKPGFLPMATWLVACGEGCCGTVQGVSERNGIGAIQNLGVMPDHRSRGLGRALLLQALFGFRRCGLACGSLEVTAQNDAAVRLYRRLGFRSRKTLYKAVQTHRLQGLDIPAALRLSTLNVPSL